MNSSVLVAPLNDFEAIYNTYYKRIYYHIRHLIGGSRYAQLAEDLTQDCFLKAFKSFGNLHDDSNISAWLYRIATNTATDALRRRQLIKWYSLEKPMSKDEGSEESWMRLLTSEGEEDDPQQRYNGPREAIQAALAQLPTQYRLPLLMREEGYEYPEIAQALNISSSALKMRMMRARNHLQQLYKRGERREEAAAL
jgi:RNA polymerase sigma-70 factor (ECF subfamily)